MPISSPLDSRFCELTRDAVGEGLKRVQETQDSGGYIGLYSPWTSISYWDNGMPNLTRNRLSTGPRDYHSVFSRWGEPKPAPLNSLAPLNAYVESETRLFDYYRRDSELVSVFVAALVHDLVDRFIHIHDTTELTDDKFLLIYLPREQEILGDNLPFDVVVPILFVHFDCDEQELASGVSIKRLDESLQLARAEVTSSLAAVTEPVLSAATHAFRIRGYTARWSPLFASGLSNDDSLQGQDKVDLLFGALRVVTGAPTGYAQLLTQPIGWAGHYRGPLPAIAGDVIRYWRLDKAEAQEHWGLPV